MYIYCIQITFRNYSYLKSSFFIFPKKVCRDIYFVPSCHFNLLFLNTTLEGEIKYSVTAVTMSSFAVKGVLTQCAGGSVDQESSVKWDTNWDKRAPHTLVKPQKQNVSGNDEEDTGVEKLEAQVEIIKPTAVRNLILIRHGQYNTDGKTDQENYLTRLGKKQAELLGRRLKLSNVHFTSIISSSMTRAIETAKIVLRELGDCGFTLEINDPMLCEGAPCVPEPNIAIWRPDHVYMEEGLRIEAAFRKYFYRAPASQETDTHEIIVGHANVIRYFVCRALQFPKEAWARIDLNHCSYTLLTIFPNGRVSLGAFGDSGHIPQENISM